MGSIRKGVGLELKRRGRRSVAAGLLLALGALGALGWGLSVYVGLVRLEARVADACSRAEAASRLRLELVENLLRETRALENGRWVPVPIP